MRVDQSQIQQHKLYVELDGGKTHTIRGRTSVSGSWGATAEISFTSVTFDPRDAAIFLVNLRGKQVRIERSIDEKFGTVINQKFEETAMLTGLCYVLRLVIRLETESGIPQNQSNAEVAFRG